ncbi:MAG: ABC transporter permease [Planctomycetaceae bacterium]
MNDDHATSETTGAEHSRDGASDADGVRSASDAAEAQSATVESTPTGTEIRISGMNLSAGGRPLLVDSSATFPAGQVTLILGCSGVGKSLLLRILAGLIDAEHSAINFSGTIDFRVNGVSERRDHADQPVAVVFQSFALFDELTPSENVEIALDHCRPRAAGESSAARARQLLQELGVPIDRVTSVLSGGQQQRLAIARAVGMETDVVLYDEPTSGLDARTAEQVADLIRDTQRNFRRTTIIVTHDYHSLRRIADRVVVLNHHTRKLDELPEDKWNTLPEILGSPPAADDASGKKKTVPQRIAGTVRHALAVTGHSLEQALLLPWSLLPLWKSFRWGLRSTWHYFRLVSGISACVYIAIAGMIIGFVAQDFIFRYLPFRQYTEPLLIENLLHATGFSLYRFLVPILCTILISARSGAAVAADVGSKVYGNQIDAMKTIGMNPERSLRTPILYAFLLGVPLLTMLSYAVASLTSAFAFLSTHADYGVAYWDAHFHKELRLPESVFYKGSNWLIAKLLTCAAGIAMIAWHCGSSPKQSGPEISKGVTQTILWSTLFTLLVHFVYSLFEFTAPV